MYGDATSRERDQRTGVGIVLGQVGISRRGADDTRSHRLAAVEDLDVNSRRRHAQVCQRLGVSEQTLHRWRNQYGGIKADEAKRLKELEAENARLKRLVAELALDKQMLQEVAQKKW